MADSKLNLERKGKVRLRGLRGDELGRSKMVYGPGI
jgi:hypothetical protein